MTTFDRAAHFYDQTRGFPPGVGEQVAAALVNLVGCSSTDRILELGIGTGRVAKPLVALLGPNHRLTGVDLSRRMMDRLVAAALPELRRPDLAEASVTFLPFPAQTFRAILVVHVLHLVCDWRAAIAEALRVRAGGGVLVGGWNDHPRWVYAVSPAQRVQYTLDAYQIALRDWNWCRAVALWAFRFPGEQHSVQDYFTFVTPQFLPKPIYDAVKQANTRAP